MREIKFRAWDKTLKEMDEPFGFDDITCYGQLFANGVDLERTEDYEFMQYTGLKDNSGKEIYEGDVLQTSLDLLMDSTVSESDKMNVKVYYEHACWFITGVSGYKPLAYSEWTLGETLQTQDDVRVIGNIYENPELLDGSH